MRILFLVLMASIPLQAAADELIRIAPEQAAKAGIATASLAEMKTTGGVRLPAQVVVPPAQIEVIAAPLPAMVATVGVAYGEAVRKGQVLARLQGAPLLELQREYAQARAQADLAAETLKRDESLFVDGIIAQARLSATQAAERQARLLLAERHQALRLTGLPEPGMGGALSATTTIRAPFDGVVLEAPAQPGQRVDAMTSLFKLGRLSPLWFEIQASAAQAARFAPGDAVVVPGCAVPAKVVLVAPQMQMASQSLLIRAELAKPAGCVKPFQFVQAEVTPAKGLSAGVWHVPTAALARHQDRVWVFAAVAGGFQPSPVKVLDESAGTTSVAVDLPADARIAVKGVAAIKATWLGLGASEE